MRKKFFSLLLVIAFIFPCLFCVTACDYNVNVPEQTTTEEENDQITIDQVKAVLNDSLVCAKNSFTEQEVATSPKGNVFTTSPKEYVSANYEDIPDALYQTFTMFFLSYSIMPTYIVNRLQNFGDVVRDEDNSFILKIENKNNKPKIIINSTIGGSVGFEINVDMNPTDADFEYKIEYKIINYTNDATIQLIYMNLGKKKNDSLLDYMDYVSLSLNLTFEQCLEKDVLQNSDINMVNEFYVADLSTKKYKTGSVAENLAFFNAHKGVYEQNELQAEGATIITNFITEYQAYLFSVYQEFGLLV